MRDKISLCLIVAMPAGAMILGLLGKPTEMGLYIVAGGIALAFANIDKIQRFKGAGFEAEMRKAVEEAYATTESLKSIAKPLILSTLSNLIYSGRWGGMNSDRKHAIKKEMDQLASSMGIFDQDIRAESEKFFAWHAIDHVNHLKNAVHKTAPLNEAENSALNEMVDRGTDKFPSLATLREFVASLSLEQQATAQPYLEDYEYYLQNRAVRRASEHDE